MVNTAAKPWHKEGVPNPVDVKTKLTEFSTLEF